MRRLRKDQEAEQDSMASRLQLELGMYLDYRTCVYSRS